MDNVLQFFASFCVAAIFIGALYFLCPDGATSNTVKYTLSLVFMCIIISAAGIALPKFNFEPIEPHTFSESQLEMEITFARQVYARALYSKKIKFTSIEVFTNKLADGGIVISKVQIRSDHTAQEIFSALEGIDPIIQVEVIND